MGKNHTKDGYVSARTTKSTEKYFKGNKLKGSGAISSLVLESFPTIYQETVEETKKNFSREELLTILSSCNGHLIDPKVPVLKDIPPMKQEFEGFDIQKLRKKISSLPYSELFLIEIWANTFWYGNSPTDDPEEYIK